MKRRVEAYY